jgi:hypothetical protein
MQRLPHNGNDCDRVVGCGGYGDGNDDGRSKNVCSSYNWRGVAWLCGLASEVI